MQDSHLIRVFSLFSARERNRFHDYVHSPFFNKNRKIQQLCDLIIGLAPEYTHPSLEKPAIYTRLYGPISYNEYQLNNVISDLLQLAYNFLAMLQYEKQPALNKQFVMEELLEREQSDQVKKIGRSFQTLLDKSPHRNYIFHQHQYHFHENMTRYNLSTQMRATDEHLQLQSDHLDLYYLSNKLRIACDMASRNIVTSGSYKCHFLPTLLPYYEANFNSFQQHPSLKVYVHILQLVEERKEAQFQFLKHYLPQHHHLFPNAELRVIYLYLQNYCIFQINSGQSSYYQELRDLYDLLLKEGILFKNGYIQQWTYKNIVTVGIRLLDYDWTEAVIHQYQHNLLPEERVNAVAYNLAALYYARQQYKEALQQLHNVEFTDTSYHLGAKIIQLKSYYELDETEALFALIEAFKKYLSRNKELAAYRKQANANFLRLTKKVYRLKKSKIRDKANIYLEKKKKTIALLKKLQPVANKDWLEEAMLAMDR